MLINVNIKNLALIKHIDLCLGEGLNIMTGETGAGKSIIIGSILIALGGKIPKDMIREGEREAFVELVFLIDNENTLSKLNELGVDTEDDKVIISRKIVNGRSMIRVNGENYTTSALKKITELLIDIHGQHDHQSLLNAAKHIDILDEYAGASICNTKHNVEKLYKEYKDIERKLSEQNINEDERMREISFCKYEIDEIDDANLNQNEYLEYTRLFQKMSYAKNIIQKMDEVYGNIEGNDGVNSRISESLRLVSQVIEQDEKLNDIYSSLLDMESIASDLGRGIRDYIEEMSFDEEKVAEIEKRLEVINKLRQKYAGYSDEAHVVENILKHRDEQKEKLEKLMNIEENRRLLSEKLNLCRKKLQEESEKLSELRKAQAKRFEKEIVEVLNGLNFLDVNFKVNFETKPDFSSKGIDNVEFLISTNPGESIKSLAKIASGGELSRIMLGIKTIMASKDNIDTLIFDEIDTGISGKTAQLVAERMKEVALVHQVICITHLPQIAAMANEHFVIEKKYENNETVTNIEELDYDESVSELARMLSGSEITNAVIENAREMKKAGLCADR